MAAAVTASSSSSLSARQKNDDSVSPKRATENGRQLQQSPTSDARSLSEAGQKKLSSFPSRQRKMGPAPLASFEDLSMDKTTSDSSSADERNTLPGIGEASEPLSPNSPIARTAVLTVPASPRIRVSAASSSSAHDTDSKESTPDRELFVGYTKKDYCEEMSDVKTSTEELLDEEQKIRKSRIKKTSIEGIRQDEALKVSTFNRKESSSSVLSDKLLPVTSEHSSRLSSLGSIGSHARRSPSPHKMLLETSFCGSKPIQQPSIDLEDPPISSTKLLNYTFDNIEALKSPTETRELSQSPPRFPSHWRESSDTPPQVRSQANKPASAVTKSETIDSPKRSQFQERRDKIDQELTRIHQQQSPRRSTPERNTLDTEHRSRVSEYQKSALEVQARMKESSDLTDSPKSPRLGKKVLPPHVPDLKDLRKTGSPCAPVPPPPPPGPTNNSAPNTATESMKSKSYSITPSASPKLGRKYFGKKNKDGTGSAGSTPSTSRKSSFSSLFRRGDTALSPVTPDSPGSISGRKSPFSQLIKSAKNEFRSRSRSRSRSKSRDRDLADDTHDRRGVLSIFKPKQKKKGDTDENNGDESKDTENKSSEAILNVEFKFKNDENEFASDPFCPFEQTFERNEAVNESCINEPKLSIESEPIKTNVEKESHDSSSSEMSLKKSDSKKETSDSYRSVIESLEQRQKEIAEKAEKPDKTPSMQEKTEEVKDVSEPNLQQKLKEEPIVPKKIEELVILSVPNEEDSRSESERESEIEYYKKKQQLGIEDEHATSSDVEIKKLVAHDFNEDEELPYVPTTLPQERSQATPMIPVKDRAPSLRMIQAIDRPRSTTPILPSRLDQYKESSEMQESESDSEKIMITIPKKGLPPKGIFKQSSKSWEDFCQEGLKSPRTLRREYKENSSQSADDELKSSTKSVSISEIVTQNSAEVTPQESPKNWINFEEMPDIVLKPVRQIKTVPTKQTIVSPTQSDPARKPKLIQQKKINDAYNSPETHRSRQRQDSDKAEDLMPAPIRSTTSTPERDDSSERSSDSERLGSQSSSEELTTIREKIAEIKKRGDKQDLDDSSDLERLLAPVNDCIAKLSSLSVQKPDVLKTERKSPIPDNWADFLLPPQPGRRSRLSSLGSDAGSIGGGRSPSPSHMLLETSFCGSQPIDDPGFAEPNVPLAVARKMSGISLGDLSPLVPRSELGATSSLHHFHQSDRASILSDSSAEGPGRSRDGHGLFDPHHHRSASEYSSRNTPHMPPPPPRRNLHPFGMDLEVGSNRSSVVSQEMSPPESPS